MGEKRLVLPEGKKAVDVLEFARREDVTEVLLPEGLELIGTKGFSHCTALRRLYLPLSLTHIDMKAFEGCPLEDIYYAGSREQWADMEISPVMSQSISAARLHCMGTGRPPARQEDRTDYGPQQLEQIRRLLEQGGDGRLHIILPDLAMEGVLTKPGDLSLLIFPKGTTLLLDTGYKDNWPRVRDFLRGAGLRRIDLLAFTHSDNDHVSNARAIADLILQEQGGSIGRFWWTGQQYGSVVSEFAAYLKKRNIPMDLHVRDGYNEEIAGVYVEVLGPTEEDMLRDSSDGEIRNAQSMMLKLTYGAATYLTCGDLYADQEQRVIRRLGGRLRADVSKTNHHGAYTSNTEAWQEAVDSRVFLTCASDIGNTPLARQLRQRGAAYYSTGCQGTLLLAADRDGTWEIAPQFHRGLRCLQRVNE